MTFSQTVAIAAVSTCVSASGTRSGVAAVAALKVTGEDDALAFAFHTHVPTTPWALHRWIDRLIADDPLLIGYRLGRISRLLQGAGYDRRLIAGFSRQGRCELLEVERGRVIPLSVAAALCGIGAIDENALLPLAPIAPHVAADLALVNVVASWIVHVRRAVPVKADADADAGALAQVSRVLVGSAIPLPLVAAIVVGAQ